MSAQCRCRIGVAYASVGSNTVGAVAEMCNAQIAILPTAIYCLVKAMLPVAEAFGQVMRYWPLGKSFNLNLSEIEFVWTVCSTTILPCIFKMLMGI